MPDFVTNDFIWYGIAIFLGIAITLFLFITLRRAIRRLMMGERRLAIERAWREVEDLVSRNDSMSLRLAVIHADAVLDMALMAKGFPGGTMGKRLQFGGHKYRSLRKAGWAHGLRNSLAHEADRELRRSEARGAIAAFRTALKDLGAL